MAYDLISFVHTLEISLIRNTSKKDFLHGDKASSRARKSLTRFIIYLEEGKRFSISFSEYRIGKFNLWPFLVDGGNY
jgi:hypothetical protein